jgi:hypothetical protein
MRNPRDLRTLGPQARFRPLCDGEACAESISLDEASTEQEVMDGRAERFEGELLQRFDF